VIVEFLLFFAVSAVSMTVGSTLMGWLIKQFGAQTTIAFGANILSSLAINYVMRKFFVFKG
jgi:putative flippase GtrA